MTHSTEKRNLEFVGIDIAKGKFDICLGSDNKKYSMSNSIQGFRQLITLLPNPNECIIVIHHAMKRCNIYPESGDTIPIQKTKTNWLMSPVSYQLIRYAIPAQTQFR